MDYQNLSIFIYKYIQEGFFISAMFLSKYSLLLIFCLLLLASSQHQEPIDLSFVVLKEGFKIDVYAQVPNARQIVKGQNGVVFVSTMEEGKVFALLDRDGDHKVQEVKTLAENLTMPNGVALRNGSLYVAEVSRILRFDNIYNTLDNPTYIVVKEDLPNNTWHGWKFIDFGPDGKLYIPIGAPCNVCDDGYPFAAIHRMNPDGTQFQTFAQGIRNSVGFDWDPQTKHLWFTDNGRDYLGDDIPPDELNYAPVIGNHYGFPYCHGHDIVDPDFGTKDCSLYVPPKHQFEAHVAALGVNFYTSDGFPEQYKGGMFIAQRGSWNRKQKIGYRVVFVKISGDKVIQNETFAYGWLNQTEQTAKGRPVDTEQLDDGSLLVSDDDAGIVYRIYHEKQSNTKLIVIIVVASVVGLAIIGGGIYLVIKLKKSKLGKRSQLQEESYHQQVDTN